MAEPVKYYLFLDECGDQNLVDFDPEFPIFTLCGIVVSDEQLRKLETQIKELKNKFWGEKQIILHSRDIRKCQNGFEILLDLNVKKEFYSCVNQILGQDIYTIICCAILKEPYIRQYGKLNDVYALSLSFIMERTVFFLDSLKQESIELNTIIERRGKKEDNALLAYYNQLMDKGTYWVESSRIKKYFKTFEPKYKSENVTGLQIADLIAYPITRYILNKDAVNYAYDVIKDNIYTDNGKVYGLKVFPT
ncbi:MAG: DUF3800 domain-containing protein [Paludibacteraceae bacterium]|nr:DUF3800 domain-containing protein [Paludibacteraceae bacterium]